MKHERDIDHLAQAILESNIARGFWEYERRSFKEWIYARPRRLKKRNFGEMMALAMSELGEAVEEDRSGRPPVWFEPANGDGIRKPEGSAVEIADAIIRLLDTANVLLLDSHWSIGDVVALKMAYNTTRPYKHGKRY